MRYNSKNHSVELSVSELCGAVFSHGSLNVPYSPFSYAPSATEIVNQKKSLEDGRYTPDVTFDFTCSFSGIHFCVSGKADGILKKENHLTVTLVRATHSRDVRISPDDETIAELSCLSLFACDKYNAENASAVLVVMNTKTGKETEFTFEYSADLLRRTYMGYLSKIQRRAKLIINHTLQIKNSVDEMKFPYKSVRLGQRELIEECYRAIYNGKRLFVQAPTGIGKTISTLYPAVKALGRGLCDKIFYLTAKASTRREAFGAIRKMHDAGADIKAIILSSKEQMCLNTGAKMSGIGIGKFCNPDGCSLAKGYFDRVNDALTELLENGSGFTSRIISEKAQEYGICPYELSLDLSEHCDIIICDYNYVFDPNVYLRRYFDGKQGQYVFLTDEAHNLADRARDTYSTALSLSEFEAIYSKISKEESKIYSAFEEIIRDIQLLKALCADNLTYDTNGKENGFYISRDPLSAFGKQIYDFSGICETWLRNRKNESNPLYNDMNEIASKVRNYLGILEYYDEKFRTYIVVEKSNITIRLFCLDPSHILDTCMNRARACVLFSATLTPTDYFVDVLGGGKKSAELSLPSPFDQSHLCLCAASYISTRYADREASSKKIADCIAASVLSKKGNYMVYFPSYIYLETVVPIFQARYPKVKTVVQTRNMTNAERDSFIDSFKENTNSVQIGFCVLGGSFSEGVDLPGNRLIGSIVVGVGLPQLSNELNIIREFYDIKCERGYDYAYTYPGMNKVLQACGRVIRREEDRGIVVLIDDRYATPQYMSLFPEHWNCINFASSNKELAKLIKEFWKNQS